MSGVAVAVAGAAIVGSLIAADAAKSAASSQAKALREASKTVAAGASRARTDVLDTMTPALADYGKEVDQAETTIRRGTIDVMKMLQAATGQANKILNQTGANAQKAILGSSASSAGIPRTGFDQRYTAIAQLPPEQQADAYNQMSQAIGQRVSQTTGEALPTEAVPTQVPGMPTGRLTPEGTAMPVSAVPGVTPGAAPGTGFYGATENIDMGTMAGLSQLAGGVATARGDIMAGRDTALGQIAAGREGALGALRPYTDAGEAAMQREAALSGALGPEAQQQAINEFIESPGQKFLRERQEQTLLRNEAALGGLGGGRVRTALQEQAMGIAATQQQSTLENLRSIAMRGQEAGGMVAGIHTGTAAQEAGISTQSGAQLAALAEALGVRSADLINMNAQQKANLAMQAGLSLAQLDQAIGMAKTGTLSQFASQQAATIAGGASDIAGLQATAATNKMNIQQNLATMLANIGTGAATQTAGLQVAQGGALAAGQLAQGQAYANIASNLGTVAAYGLGANKAPVASPPPASSLSMYAGF